MKKLYTFIFLLFTATILFAAYPSGSQNNIDGSNLGWDDALKWWRPIAVDDKGSLKTDSAPSVASITLNTSSIDEALRSDNANSAIASAARYIVDNSSGTAVIASVSLDVATISAEIASMASDVGKIKDSVRSATETATIIGKLTEIKDAIPAGGGSSSWTSEDVRDLLDDKLGTSSSLGTLLGYASDATSYLYHTVIEESGSSSYSTARILYNIWKQPNTVTMDTFICDASGASAATPTTLELTDTLFKTAVQASSPVANLNTRVFIELRAEDPEATFKIAFRNDFQNFYRTVKGRILLECNNESVWIKAESPVKLFITEGWK